MNFIYSMQNLQKKNVQGLTQIILNPSSKAGQMMYKNTQRKSTNLIDIQTKKWCS